MKNNNVKVILITIFIIVLILSCVVIIAMNMHNETFKATIIKKYESIRGNPMILVERIYYNNGELVHGDYFDILISEKTSITYKGKKIDISELKEGDTVSITYTDEYVYTTSPTPINNTRKIKLLEKAESN